MEIFKQCLVTHIGLCEHIYGMEVKGLLNEFEHYSQYWNKKDVDTVVAMRAPLTWRSEVNTLLNISDVFFLPSYYESFGLVVLEAAFTNKPIVLRDLEIYRSIYNDTYLCGKNNKEFIKLIRLLKDDKKIYNKYVNCSKKIKVMYNEKSIYNKWKKLYSSIKR